MKSFVKSKRETQMQIQTTSLLCTEKGKHFWFAAYMFYTNVNTNKIVSWFDHSRLITDKINLSIVCRKQFMDIYICLSPARKLNQPYQYIISGSVIGSNYRCDGLLDMQTDTELQRNSTINALLCRLTLFIDIKLSLNNLLRYRRWSILTSYLNCL